MAAAEQARGRYVRLADRAARIYAPAVHMLGLATFLGWLLAGHGWESALTCAIAVLIITCPCALALAVPAVQVAASSRLFASGTLLKAPDGLERLAEVDTVVFDKTGTITLGQPSLAGAGGIGDEILGPAARLAAGSRHPYARAVVRAAEARGLAVEPAADVLEVPGFGLELAGPHGSERLGSAAWCGARALGPGRPCGIAPPMAQRQRSPSRIRLRPDAPESSAPCTAPGFATELLSGDRAPVVEAAAARTGIGRWQAGSPARPTRLPGSRR